MISYSFGVASTSKKIVWTQSIANASGQGVTDAGGEKGGGGGGGGGGLLSDELMGRYHQRDHQRSSKGTTLFLCKSHHEVRFFFCLPCLKSTAEEMDISSRKLFLGGMTERRKDLAEWNRRIKTKWLQGN